MDAKTEIKELDVLVLQGGGALGAYQAGAFETLFASGRHTDWVAGVSIGAINAALIAGNPAGRRVERLRMFWERISQATAAFQLPPGFAARGIFNELSAGTVMATGVPGFFQPRFPPAFLMPPGSAGATSFYDTAPLRDTLLDLVDFDYLNDGPTRFSTGAVNVETGNMIWFDSAHDRIGPEHVMASGALPPGFPAVEIDGQFYWDGGLVSNTPLQYVYDERGPDDLCVFQVDLFSARGPLPASVWDIEARAKDIRFSSRTRLNTDMLCEMQTAHVAGRRLYEKLPPELRDDPDARALLTNRHDPKITVAHLIYRQTPHETQSKDYEFSRSSMLDHWKAGAQDTATTLAHPEWIARHDNPAQVRIFDLADARP
ncbi:patatin-like phospholipase family protein [Jannaschia helgolandensis]|uniref:patatin-like phospholipase family protein n=1 Tax=Jannaschia helgolandensis TaxID=188906 RepID=UPI0030D8A8EF